MWRRLCLLAEGCVGAPSLEAFFQIMVEPDQMVLEVNDAAAFAVEAWLRLLVDQLPLFTIVRAQQLAALVVVERAEIGGVANHVHAGVEGRGEAKAVLAGLPPIFPVV